MAQGVCNSWLEEGKQAGSKEIKKEGHKMSGSHQEKGQGVSNRQCDQCVADVSEASEAGKVTCSDSDLAGHRQGTCTPPTVHMGTWHGQLDSWTAGGSMQSADQIRSVIGSGG